MAIHFISQESLFTHNLPKGTVVDGLQAGSLDFAYGFLRTCLLRTEKGRGGE